MRGRALGCGGPAGPRRRGWPDPDRRRRRRDSEDLRSARSLLSPGAWRSTIASGNRWRWPAQRWSCWRAAG